MAINKDSFAFTVYLGGLGVLPALSIDMGLPALSYIATALHTTASASSLTLSLFLAGFAIAPIVGGPCADRFGRRPVLLSGCLLFALAAIGCTFAPTIETLLAFRLIQGFGAGAAAVLSMVVVRDLFEGNEARARLSYVSILRSLGPMIAPTIGAWLLSFSNWRCIYGVLAFAGVVLLVATAKGFAESASHDRLPLTLTDLKASYLEVIRHRVSFGYAAVNALVFGGMFAYVSNSPLLMIRSFGLSNQLFGYFFAGTAMGIMLGAFVNGKLSERNIPHTKPMFAGLLVACTATAVNVALTLTGHAAPLTLLPFLVMYTFSAGLIASNCAHGCLHPMPRIAGVASAVLTFTQMVIGAVSSAIVAFLYDGTAFAMTGAMAVFIFSAASVYFLIVRPAENKC